MPTWTSSSRIQADHRDPVHQQLANRLDASPQQGMRVPSALGVIQGAGDGTDRQVSGRLGWLELTSEVAARGLSNPGGNSGRAWEVPGRGTPPSERERTKVGSPSSW